ncbi:mok12 [Symbiodinium necroappetens]|uniref:Mok12 protein n=1 Tax=Symbiodinium necroappetens TaxID=1628268 RepID=A0A812LGH7_9DINO|nr:mok12 [Symbiodinium necroappetens]
MQVSVTECRNWREVLAVVENLGDLFDFRNTSTAVHRVAKSSVEAGEAQLAKADHRFPRLLQLLRAKCKDLSAWGLSDATWGMAKMQCKDDEIFTRLSLRAQSIIQANTMMVLAACHKGHDTCDSEVICCMASEEAEISSAITEVQLALERLRIATLRSPHRAASADPLPEWEVVSEPPAEAAAFPDCPQHCLDLCLRLSCPGVPSENRARRAWRAGCWAREVLAGRWATPLATPALPAVRPVVYVVLFSSKLPSPARFSTFAALRAVIGEVSGLGVALLRLPGRGQSLLLRCRGGVTFTLPRMNPENLKFDPEGVGQPCALTWPLPTQDAEEPRVLALPLKRRPGGFMLALPAYLSHSLTEDAASEEPLDMLGLSLLVSVPAVEEDEQGEEVPVGLECPVLLLDVDDGLAERMVPYDPVTDIDVVPFVLGSSQLFPQPEALQRAAREWVEGASSEKLGFYTAAEELPEEAVVPAAQTPKRQPVPKNRVTVNQLSEQVSALTGVLPGLVEQMSDSSLAKALTQQGEALSLLVSHLVAQGESLDLGSVPSCPPEAPSGPAGAQLPGRYEDLERQGGYAQQRGTGLVMLMLATIADCFLRGDTHAAMEHLGLALAATEQSCTDNGRWDLGFLLTLLEEPAPSMFAPRGQAANTRLRACSPLVPPALGSVTLAYVREVDLLSQRRLLRAGGHAPQEARTPFSAFLSRTLHLCRRGVCAPAHVLFPLPLPHPAIFQSCLALSSRRRAVVAERRLLHVLVMALNFLHQDPLELLQRPPNEPQARCLSYLGALVRTHGSEQEGVTPSIAGRRIHVLQARLGELSRRLSDLGPVGDIYSWVPPADPVVLPDTLPEDQQPYQPAQAERLQISGRGLWDPLPFLPPVLQMAYAEPRIFAARKSSGKLRQIGLCLCITDRRDFYCQLRRLLGPRLCLTFAFASPTVQACFSSVLQGDHLGVEVATASHSAYLESKGLFLPRQRLQANQPVLNSQCHQGLIIDDFFAIAKISRSAHAGLTSSTTTPAKTCMDEALAAYQAAGLEGSAEKDVVNATVGSVAGAEVDSRSSTLARGLCVIGAPRSKRFVLSVLSLEACLLPLTLSTRVCWEAGPQHARFVGRVSEFQLAAALAPVACSDVAAPYADRLYATALLRRADPMFEERPEADQASPERPLAFLFDFLALGDVSPHYCLSLPRLLDWVFYLIDEDRVRAIYVAAPLVLTWQGTAAVARDAGPLRGPDVRVLLFSSPSAGFRATVRTDQVWRWKGQVHINILEASALARLFTSLAIQGGPLRPFEPPVLTLGPAFRDEADHCCAASRYASLLPSTPPLDFLAKGPGEKRELGRCWRKELFEKWLRERGRTWAGLQALAKYDVEQLNEILIWYGQWLYAEGSSSASASLGYLFLVAAAGILAICWGGLARVGEAMAARRRDLVLPDDVGVDCGADGSMILMAVMEPKTRFKAARHQCVKVDQPQLVKLIRCAFQRLRADEKLWPRSGATLRARFQKLLSALGIPPNAVAGVRDFDIASLRAGGATWLMGSTESPELVRRRGRWVTAKVMEIYIQEMAAMMFLPRLEPELRENIFNWANVFDEAFEFVVWCQSLGLLPKYWLFLLQQGVIYA